MLILTGYVNLYPGDFRPEIIAEITAKEIV